MSRSSVSVVLTVLVTLAFAASARAVTITEFPIVNPGGADPLNIITGPDGNLWWTEGGSNPGVGRINPSGEAFPLIEDSRHPVDLVAAPSGWVSWVSEGGWGVRNPSGTVNEVATTLKGGAITLTAGNEVRFGGSQGASVAVLCTPEVESLDHLEAGQPCLGEKGGGRFIALAASSGNTLWSSTTNNAVKIFSATPVAFGKIVELPTESVPRGIAIGPEGSAWVAMSGADAVDRIDPNGGRTRFALPADSEPFDLVFGPDGAFWVLETGLGKVARMTTAGLVTGEYAVPSGFTGQIGITVGPDKSIWFTDTDRGAIGRLVPDPLSSSGGGGGGSVPPPAAAPRFTGSPSFSPARFRVVGSGGSRSAAGVPAGSTLRFSLSTPATVTATIFLKTLGRRAGKGCVAPAKAKPGAKKCTRLVRKGRLKLSAKAGANKFAFSGKLGGKPLTSGAYQASFTAKSPAGLTSTPAKASFTIVS
jgi:streptogramin lyase